MAHPKYGQDIDLTEDLFVDVRRPLRNHRDPDTADAALFHQAAHGTQADFLATVLRQLRSERVGLVDIEVERGPVDAKQLACKVGGEPDLIFRQHQPYIEDGREAVLVQSRRQHPPGMRFERSICMVSAEDDHRVPRSIAAGRRPQSPPCASRIDGRDLLFMAQQLLRLDRCGIAFAAALPRQNSLRRRDQLDRKREAVFPNPQSRHFSAPFIYL